MKDKTKKTFAIIGTMILITLIATGGAAAYVVLFKEIHEMLYPSGCK